MGVRVLGRRLGAAVPCLAGMAISCDTAKIPPLDPVAHQVDVAAWREYRYDLLEREGWLKLTGLHWLEPGANSFGAAEDNALVLRGHGLPPRIGTLVLRDEQIRIHLAPDVPVMRGDARFRDTLIAPVSAEDSTVLTLGSVSWHVMRRRGAFALRVQDTLSPLRMQFQGIESFPLTGDWRLSANFERYDPPKPIQVPSVLGGVNERASPGAVVFRVGGETYRLDVTGDPADSSFWIQFGDLTNGVDTYGGGRYVWVDAPADGDDMIIDFNKSYNPPCVFTPYATCPLPPLQNKLPIRIEAGELSYEGPSN